MKKENWVHDGKFYNPETSTLILKSINDKEIRKYYKSKSGIYFITTINIEFTLPDNIDMTKEKVCGEISFKELRIYLEHVKKGNVWSYKHQIINDLPEFNTTVEV